MTGILSTRVLFRHPQGHYVSESITKILSKIKKEIVHTLLLQEYGILFLTCPGHMLTSHDCNATKLRSGICQFQLRAAVSKKWMKRLNKMQDSNAASTSAEIFPNCPWAQDRYCGRSLGGGTKKRCRNGKNKKVETSPLIVTFMLHVITYVVSKKLLWNLSSAVYQEKPRYSRI